MATVNMRLIVNASEIEKTRRMVSALSFLCAVTAASASAQVPAPSVTVAFGLDTTIADVRDIVGLTRAYLVKPDSSARSRGLWSTSTAFDRNLGDVGSGSVYQGFPVTILGVVPAKPGDSVYVVKILHASVDSSRRQVSPLALQRLYAVRENGGPFPFRLSAALPRVTRGWTHRSKGRITFWYAPGQRPNASKISSAARFVDSVAKLFSVPGPRHLDVYVTPTIEDGYRALGLDFSSEASGPGEGRGGLTPASEIVIGADPEIGEAYFHEYVHAVLGGKLRGGNRILPEGVAVWLGGSRSRTTREMYALLRRYQEANPTLSLSAFLNDENEDNRDAKLWTDVHVANGALFADALFRKQGINGVRSFYELRGSTESLLHELATRLGLLGTNMNALDNWWRAETKRLSTIN